MSMFTLSLGEVSIQVPAVLVAQKALEAALQQFHPVAELKDATADGVPALGEYWPGQGGVLAGLVRGRGGVRDYYLIVPPGDDAETTAKFGGYEHETPGADSAWDGAANTAALLADEQPHPAAQFAAGFSRDGHNDYFLPSRSELQIAEANVPEVFSKAWHWSSSQYSALSAWLMDFSAGGQSYGDKGFERRVRPVRRVFL